MKKKILFIVVLLSINLFSQENNDNRFSILFQNGMGLSEISLNSNLHSGTSQNISLLGSYNFKNGYLLTTGVSQNQITFIANTFNQKIEAYSIPLKFGFNFSVGKKKTSKTNLLAAIGFTYNIYSNVNIGDVDVEINDNNYSFVADLGANFILSDKLFLNIYFNNTTDFNEVDFANGDNFKIKKDKKINISIGYNF